MPNNHRSFDSIIEADGGLILPYGAALGNLLVSDANGQLWPANNNNDALQAGYLGQGSGSRTPITGAINSSTGVITLSNLPTNDTALFPLSTLGPLLRAACQAPGTLSPGLPASGMYRYVAVDAVPPTQPGLPHTWTVNTSADKSSAVIAAQSPTAVATGNIRVWDGLILNTSGSYSLVASVTNDSYCIPATTGRDRRPWARGAFWSTTHVNTSDYVTSSSAATVIDSTNLSVRIECTGVPLRVVLIGRVGVNPSSEFAAFGFNVDGSQQGSQHYAGMTNFGTSLGASYALYDYVWAPAAGSHLIQPTFAAGGGATVTLYASSANFAEVGFIVEEFVRQNADNGTT